MKESLKNFINTMYSASNCLRETITRCEKGIEEDKEYQLEEKQKFDKLSLDGKIERVVSNLYYCNYSIYRAHNEMGRNINDHYLSQNIGYHISDLKINQDRLIEELKELLAKY